MIPNDVIHPLLERPRLGMLLSTCSDGSPAIGSDVAGAVVGLWHGRQPARLTRPDEVFDSSLECRSLASYCHARSAELYFRWPNLYPRRLQLLPSIQPRGDRHRGRRTGGRGARPQRDGFALLPALEHDLLRDIE